MDKTHNRYKHGMTYSRPYRIWAGIKRRCYNKNEKAYSSYGAKGIKMCDRWLDFELFWEDMKDTYKDSLTIDRIDNSKGYCKDNCRWATMKEQARNKTNIPLYDYQGRKICISEASEITGIKRATISHRINNQNMSFSDAINKKIRRDLGVSFDKSRKKWIAKRKIKGITYFIGRFDTKEEALRAKINY